MKIAAVNWKLRAIAREEEFYDHLGELLDACIGCELIVFPELFGLELLSLYKLANEVDLPATLAESYGRIFFEVNGWFESQRSTTLLVGGSNVFPDGDQFRNRCPIFSQIARANCDKNVVTEWEKQVGLVAGHGLAVLTTASVGVTICLDAEFPASGRALAEAGMLFQCVPAWTETMRGFHRVRTACRARAVENQVCVIHSSLVGQVRNEKCVGSSAIIVPPHEPFPEDPILAETPMNEEGIAFAEVVPEDILRCREMGEVRNWRDRDAGDWTVREV